MNQTLKTKNLVFTKEDHDILNGYKNVVDLISNLFGNSCECVLHSLESLESSVIYIKNTEDKTNRKIGSPLTNKALTLLKYCEEHCSDVSPIYKTSKNDGTPMRSSTMIIRNFDGIPIGMLCINFDLSTPIYQFFNDLCHNMTTSNLNKHSNFQDHSLDEEEIFARNSSELFYMAVEKAKQKVYEDNTISIRNKNKEIIKILYKQGLFQVRTSVQTISKLLNISKDAVYLHLRALQEQE